MFNKKELKLIKDTLEHFVSWKEQFKDNFYLEKDIGLFGIKSHKQIFKYQDYRNLLTKLKG